LDDDLEADIMYDVAAETLVDLERTADVFLRIFQSQDKLPLRMMQMAEIEIDGDESSASILFRGNSLLTKTLEQYLRLVGADFLEASIGEPVRKLCTEKVEIEIDPAKFKGIPSDKAMFEQVAELERWMGRVWDQIYASRQRCPQWVPSLCRFFSSILTS
jgi:hypothetical protein